MALLMFRQTCRASFSVPRKSSRVSTLLRSSQHLVATKHGLAVGTKRQPLACRASAAAPGGSTPARHAVLHDFCMCIPYGGISLLAGIGLFFLNLTNIAGTAIVAGATSLAASVLSLQEWKAGGDSKLYTLTSAASAAVVAYTTATSLELLKGLPYWLSVVLCGLSVASAAFCAYNVLAGGNPPPKKGASKAGTSSSSS